MWRVVPACFICLTALAPGQKTDVHIGTLVGKEETWDVMSPTEGKLHLWLPTIKRTPENKDKILPIDPEFLKKCKMLSGKQVMITSRPGSIRVGPQVGIFVLSIEAVPEKSKD